MGTIIRLFSRKARARHAYILAIAARCVVHYEFDVEHSR